MSTNQKIAHEDEDDGFLTIPATAELWNLSPKTLWRGVHAGRLGVARMGPGRRLVRTTRRTREAYLASCRS